MEKIHCSKEFVEFIQRLETSDKLAEVSQNAIGKLADDLNIGSVIGKISIPVNKFTPQGLNDFQIFYDYKERMKQHWIPPENAESMNKQYTTGENGNIQIIAYRRDSDTPWDERQRMDIEGLIEIVFAFAARSRLIQQMQINSMVDMMTGLPNADGFLAFGSQLANKGELDQYAAFYWNMQNMKLFNNRHGITTGNDIIRKIASTVKEHLQEDELVARLGGDNFAALVRKEHIHTLIALLELMELTIEASEEPVSIIMKATTGVYPVDSGINNMSLILQKASTAYRAAKDILCQDIVIYSNELEKKMLDGREVLFQFMEGIQNKEFEVYYQPKVDTQNMCMIGAEALVRWYQDGKLILPMDFVPALERDVSVCKLDFYVLERVCEDLRKWLDEGTKPVRISVNFSRRHLSNNYLVEEILGVLSKYRIPRRFIEIEITETVNEKEYSRLINVIEQLHEEGIYVSIDDFGSGASSLNMLREVEADILKIDRSFIQSAVNSKKDRIVLTNIIRLAKELGIRVIVEGVETKEQMELLQELNCYLVQGYLFDKPLEKAEFNKKLEQKGYELPNE